MKNISVRIKLLLCTVPSLIALIASIIAFAVMLNQTYAEAQNVYFDTLYKVNSLLLNADRDFYQAMQAATSQHHMARPGEAFDNSKNESNRKDYENNVKQVRDRVDQAQGIAKDIDSLYLETTDANGKTFKKIYEEFNSKFDKWYAGFDSKAPTSEDSKFNNFSGIFEEAREDLNSLQEITETWADSRNGDLQGKIQNSLLALVVIFGILTVFIVLLTAYVIRNIIKGVSGVTDNMVILAQNDLTVEVKEDDAKDEIGKMNNAFATFKNNLHGAVSTMNEASNNLADAFVTMQDKTNSAQHSMREISKAAYELATAATTQAEDIADIVTDMNELNNIMTRSVNTAESLTEASNAIDGVTKKGNDTVDELAHINTASLEVFGKIFEAIESIKTQGDKISEASGLISGIANQTNLLSLNASIEAARAGEQGRGFAVVAEEIRKLSDESKTNVDVILSILQELTEATGLATRLSDEVKDYVSKQNSSVEETRNAFKNIVSTVDSVNAAIDEIESINKILEQKVTDIAGSVESLSSISEENAATAEELSSTSELVKKSVNDLVETQENVGNSSENLNNIVKQFKL
ncbi:MAG: methyl-accepting chemotaxis protein [Lachnospiraceae bacterium]|nr:methyl-accepting chemotaxis protein [Lachnospiraceae bacterium]